jgi:proline iminopeptidase
MEESFIDFKDYKTWYATHGDLSNGTPLVALHGGPGYPHYHLQNLSELSRKGIPVIFYDQLGCGKSDRPDNPKLWTIELFIEELEAIRKQLNLKTIHLLGHSWGGSLAAEYMLTKPEGIDRLILSSPVLDSQLWVDEADKLRDKMPAWAAETMRRHEIAGTTDSWEYSEAYHEFKKRFICRIEPYPELLLRCDKEMGEQVYQTMWGPSEAHCTGNLKNWSVLQRMANISVPILFISGKYDEATPKQVKLGHDAVKGSKWELLENSSHTANFEEPKNISQ